MACFAPQYAACSGIARYASAEPTCTIVPWLRGSIRFALIGIGNVGREDEGAASRRFDFAPRRLEAVDAAREERDVGARVCKRSNRRAPHAGRRSSNDDVAVYCQRRVSGGAVIDREPG